MTTPTSLLDLSGRIAVVTGAVRGIGWACAQALAEQGATVILGARVDDDRLQQRVEELGASGAEVGTMIADAQDPTSIRAAYAQIFKQYKGLDILVNNAGVLGDALVGMIGDELLAETFAINTLGPVHHMQSAARLMKRRGGGSIVFLSSIMATAGNAGQVPYSGSKAALIGVAKSAAKELARDNIRVNVVAPGFIETDLVADLSDEVRAERLDSIALGRPGSAQDVAGAVLYLVSSLGEYVTGQVLGVDGGMVVR